MPRSRQKAANGQRYRVMQLVPNTISRYYRIGCGRNVHFSARPVCTTCTRSACIRRLARTGRHLFHQQPNWAAVSIRPAPEAIPCRSPVSHGGNWAPIRQKRSTPGSRLPGNCLAGSTTTITLTRKSAPPPPPIGEEQKKGQPSRLALVFVRPHLRGPCCLT